MPQKPAVRAKKKRRDTRRLANWRAKQDQQRLESASKQPGDTAAAKASATKA